MNRLAGFPYGIGTGMRLDSRKVAALSPEAPSREMVGSSVRYWCDFPFAFRALASELAVQWCAATDGSLASFGRSCGF